jgi:hypothetical protein
MERSLASVGSGIFRSRSGCRPGDRGGPILNGFPSSTSTITKPFWQKNTSPGGERWLIGIRNRFEDMNIGSWMTRGVTQTLLRQVKDEMDGSDRAAAVVGGAFVEEQLKRLLKSRMVKDERVFKEDFAHQLELNSFDRQDIRDRCDNLTLSQSKMVSLTGLMSTSGEV